MLFAIPVFSPSGIAEKRREIGDSVAKPGQISSQWSYVRFGIDLLWNHIKPMNHTRPNVKLTLKWVSTWNSMRKWIRDFILSPWLTGDIWSLRNLWCAHFLLLSSSDRRERSLWLSTCIQIPMAPAKPGICWPPVANIWKWVAMTSKRGHFAADVQRCGDHMGGS